MFNKFQALFKTINNKQLNLLNSEAIKPFKHQRPTKSSLSNCLHDTSENLS
jgi:hypothetical protein